MTDTPCLLIGAPMDCGKRRRGCLMGPDAYRTAGLAETLTELGRAPRDLGNVTPAPLRDVSGAAHIHKLAENIAWTEALSDAAETAMAQGFPIFLGGDHALALGTVSGVANHAAAQGRPQFVLWLDAHSDFHTPQTSDSGNLHGTPLGYVTGREGFDGFPKIDTPLPHDNIAMIGLRSVDALERAALQETTVTYVDMREIDESGIAKPLQRLSLIHISEPRDRG